MSQKIIYQNILTILFILSLFQYSQAQKPCNIWYFGQNAGLDFNKEPVEALTDGQLNTDEGCATISDANGKLFFIQMEKLCGIRIIRDVKWYRFEG